MKTTLTACEAKEQAQKLGFDFSRDFTNQDRGARRTNLTALATMQGYRKPEDAEGPVSRNYFNYLKKVNECEVSTSK